MERRVGATERRVGARERMAVESLLEAPLARVEAAQQPRKRPRGELDALERRIEAMESELESAHRELQSAQDDRQREALEVASDCLAMKRRAHALAEKLEVHKAWMQRVSALMVAAPLLDLASSSDDEEKETPGARGHPMQRHHVKKDRLMDGFGQDGEEQEAKTQGIKTKGEVHPDSTLSYVDAWRRSKPDQQLAQFVVAERLKIISARASKHASRMLRSYATAQRAFPLQFESRNWHVATGSMIDKTTIFRCERIYSTVSLGQIDKMANEMWRTVECDEELRTYAPIIQDSLLEHADETRCLWRQVFQLTASSAPCSVTTVGCLDNCSSREASGWQISIASVHDSYLTLVGDQSAAKDSPLRPNSPPNIPPANVSLPPLQVDTTNDFVIGVQFTATDAGVKLLIVGAAAFNVQFDCDPAVELLQYLVKTLPIYDELYLRQFDAP